VRDDVAIGAGIVGLAGAHGTAPYVTRARADRPGTIPTNKGFRTMEITAIKA